MIEEPSAERYTTQLQAAFSKAREGALCRCTWGRWTV